MLSFFLNFFLLTANLKAGLGFVETNVLIRLNPVYEAFHRIDL